MKKQQLPLMMMEEEGDGVEEADVLAVDVVEMETKTKTKTTTTAATAMEKKKKFSEEQLELLERSFGEEIKLDPERKMKLSEELGIHPRQIAVWFQNRKARWKTKMLQNQYEILKQDFEAISKQNLHLQQEVLKLKTILRDQQQTDDHQMNYQVPPTTYTGDEIISGDATMTMSIENDDSLPLLPPPPAAISFETFEFENFYSNYNLEDLNLQNIRQ